MSDKKDFFNVEEFFGKAKKIYLKKGRSNLEDYFYKNKKETLVLMSRSMLGSMKEILMNIKAHYDNSPNKYIEKDTVFEPLFDLKNTAMCILVMLGVENDMLDPYLKETTKNGKINCILFRGLERLRKNTAEVFNSGYVNALQELYKGTLLKLSNELDKISYKKLKNKEFTDELKKDTKFIVEFVELSYGLFDINEEDIECRVNKLHDIVNKISNLK